MAQKRDSKWLEQELSRALGWDDMIVHALVEAVQQAAAPGGNRSDLDDMIQNFLAESPKGVQLINDYLAAAKAPGGGGGGGSSTGAGGTAGGSRGAPAAAAARAAAPAPKPAPAPAAAAPPARSYAASTAPAAAVTKPYQPAMGGQQAVAPAGWEPLTASANAAGGAAGPSGGGGGGGGDDFSRFVSDEPGKGGRGGGRGGSKPGSSRDLQALEASAASPEKPSPEGAKVLGMFKAGGRIKAPSAKPVGMRGPDLAATLEKKILNCLGCGKIYDCRNVTNDILRFLDRGGVCTYCGDTVPLTLKDRQNAAAAAAAADGADGAARDQAAATPEEAAAAAARAFKDRLVEYDRNAAKRTTVIDDQSDFFEIDTNAWLTDQEREELRRRRRMEEEAEAARRKRLTVTIDLIGRKVVLDEDVRKAEEEQARKAAERTAAAARAAAAAAALRNTDGDDAAAGSAYGGGVSFKGNALGGKAAGPTKEQLDAALSALRNMKATANPALASTAAPLFLPAAGAPPGGEGKGKGGEEGAGGGGGGGGSKRTGPGAAAARPKKGPARGIPLVCSRLQAGEDEFDAFGAEVVLDELMGGALMAAADAEVRRGGTGGKTQTPTPQPPPAQPLTTKDLLSFARGARGLAMFLPMAASAPTPPPAPAPAPTPAQPPIPPQPARPQPSASALSAYARAWGVKLPIDGPGVASSSLVAKAPANNVGVIAPERTAAGLDPWPPDGAWGPSASGLAQQAQMHQPSSQLQSQLHLQQQMAIAATLGPQDQGLDRVPYAVPLGQNQPPPRGWKRSRSYHEGPYDICPPDMAPSTSYSVAATLAPAGPPKAVPGLPPGLVVIKGYLKMDEQIKIVRMIRELGMGTGGFYVPSYSSGGRLNLHMMCLGLHWEPRTSKYEATRSSYDGATPPTLPKELSDLCARALAAATAASAAAGGPRLPPLKPDICLANFYERQGKLGMHQDKDEQPDSLKAGLPVVSFSIGDSADFLYGRTRDADQAECVRLESGDLLVFGGPSRMLFHAVPKIHPHTAPAELVRGCGLRPGRLNLTFRQYSAS
ncbi:hypothetical protein HYH03_014064 [Edaphochlamys debaryana]|uniref:Fe2OG dioxygenase domain-containing protein n=1 Tax=Edaphochlamys debaryana TaxID=47281 RepID=A0A835XNW9_9CHLO|nr:hypothetical protein HYH03_014064 [Edaphochlamys debaryana]|eukprot:KAG2487351.1 hypothetical protein HYH03_014064 [Edaphochlamys debaryana]